MKFKIILDQESGLGRIRRIKSVNSLNELHSLLSKELSIPINHLNPEKVSIGIEDRNDKLGTYDTIPDIGINYYSNQYGDFAYTFDLDLMQNSAILHI